MSVYLTKPGRLSDVIAAIQVMATYKFYKLPFKSWSERISGTDALTEHWRQVFIQHPEFFRLDGKLEKASLVWRRQYPRSYHVDEERKLLKEELLDLSNEERATRVSRVPLTPTDISTLLKVAIDLHSRALEEKKDSRWWIPLAAVVGSLLGSLLGSVFKLFQTGL